MSIPGGSLTPTPMWSQFLSPYNDPLLVTDTTDVSIGGIALYDASQGLQVQNWYLTVYNVGLSNSYIAISDSQGNSYTLVTTAGITWGRLSFDQNMHPVINFISNLGSGYYWYDPSIPGTTISYFDPTLNIGRVSCIMDDTRPQETLLGLNDIIMGYVANNTLYYRQQRDRYTIAYVLQSNVNTLIANPYVNKIGMNSKYRLQFQLAGQLYQ